MTEIKHLLITASEDLPPSIDLLDGLDLAPRRRPARRRPFALAGLAAGLVAAGVGIALVTSVGAPQSAQAKVAAAIGRNDGKTYRVAMSFQANADKFDFKGEFDPAHKAGRLTSDGNEAIMIGDQVYSKLPAEMESTKGMPPMNITAGKDGKVKEFSLPKGWKPKFVSVGDNAWLKMPLKKLDWGFGDIRYYAQDPQGELRDIRSAGQIKSEGPITGEGWKGERFSFTIPSVKKWFGRESSRGTVDVDSDGNVRVLDMVVSYPDSKSDIDNHYTVAFSDYGSDVKVTAPKTDHLYTEDSLSLLLHGRHAPKD